MKVLKIKQNTPEWEELRRTKIGASDCPIIMDASPYATGPRKLYNQKAFNVKQYVSQAMKDGSLLEEKIRDTYNQENKTDFQPVVTQHEEYDWMIASLDGHDESCDYILEIKTATGHLFDKYEQDFPMHWIWQAQHQMEVTGMKVVKFHVVNRTYQDNTFEYEVERDEEMISSLVEKEKKFMDHIYNYKEPELGKNETEFTERTDSEWTNLALEIANIDKQLNELKRIREEKKVAAIDLAKGEPSKGGGMTLSVQKPKTIISYSRIPEVQEIIKNQDISTYTTISKPSWKLTLSQRFE